MSVMIINSDVFNKVRGITWSLYRKDRPWNTLSQSSVNGREIVSSVWQAPLWSFIWQWGYMKDNPADIFAGNTYTDLRTFWGAILPLMGRGNEFLYQPDDSVVNVALGGQTLTVDANGNAQLVHSIGGYLEPIQELNGVVDGTNPSVYFDGTHQAAPTIAPPSTVAMPGGGSYLGYVIQGATGHVVKVNFTYYYRCRLDDDMSGDLEQMWSTMWQLKKFPFSQVRI